MASAMILELLALLLEVLDHDLDGLVQPALEHHRVGPRRHVLHPLGEDGVGQDGGGGGAVARGVLGLLGHLLDELGAHVLELIQVFLLLGDGDPVVDDLGRPELLGQHHVAPARPQRDPHRVRQAVDPPLELLPRLLVEQHLLVLLGHARSPSFVRSIDGMG